MDSVYKFFLDSKDRDRSGVIWNTAANMIFGFQSLLINIVLRMVVDLSMSGIFTIGFSNATLFLMIGKYGMRDYQVSDINEKFSFYDYRSAKYFTTFLMIVVSLIYTTYASINNSYSLFKATAMILICFLKTHDAIEDVYYCHYLKNKRLDIAGKLMFTRLMLTIVAFSIAIVISRNLVVALVVANIVSLFLLVFSIVRIFPRSEVKDCDLKMFSNKRSSGSAPMPKAKIRSILSVGFPLFLGVFLAYYVTAASKIAVDSQMNDDIMAIYGFLTMPLFVISLMNTIIFTPQMLGVVNSWEKRDLKAFFKSMWRQILIILLLTVACVCGAWLLGVPVLSIVFNTDLAPYKTELLILLVGGGLLALSEFLVIMATLIRFQKATAIGYIIGGVCAFFVSTPMVKHYGIRGAANSYVLLTGLLCLCFSIIFAIGYKKRVSEKV
ncbi:MAG: hypothetical protein MJ172_04760 [Clostridia bacterium]|nr:hypothetical protein [Clostridia bacterium]